MTKQEAALIVEESLTRGSGTPNTSTLPREAFLAAENEKLRACLIEPMDVSARPGAWAIKYAALHDYPRDLIALAKRDTTWLLYDPRTQLFYKAWSELENSDELFLLGFYSDDALAEWNG